MSGNCISSLNTINILKRIDVLINEIIPVTNSAIVIELDNDLPHEEIMAFRKAWQEAMSDSKVEVININKEVLKGIDIETKK